MYTITNANLPNIKFTAGIEQDGFKLQLGAESPEHLFNYVQTACDFMGIPNPLNENLSNLEKLEKKLSEAVDANHYGAIDDLTKAIQRLKSVN